MSDTPASAMNLFPVFARAADFELRAQYELVSVSVKLLWPGNVSQFGCKVVRV